MIKFRLYFDKDKETEWLNQMANDGYAMTGFFAGFYTFEACKPGEYIYQVDFSSKLFSVDESYREFMAEQGIEIVQIWGFWVILKRPASEGSFELYTDVDSNIAHYTKIRNLFKAVTIFELICFIIECWAADAGNDWAIFFAILIGILVLVLMNVALKTNQIIQKLKEFKGEFSECQTGKSSPLLLCGLLMNSCALVLADSISHPIKLTVQILAIVLMLIGLYRSRGFMKNS